VGILAWLVAVQAVDVSKKLFRHRQNKQTPQAVVHKEVVVCQN